MTTYTYTALSAEGESRSGRVKARSLTDARYAVQEKGLSSATLSAKRSLADIQVTTPRIKPTELMHLSRQLAAFLRAGIPILDAIRELGEGSDSRAVARVLEQIANDLRAGSTLSEAFGRHPKEFPPYYLGILLSAELTGQLDVVLDQLAGYLERDLEAGRKLRSAMVYPTIVAIMSMGTVAVLTLVVLPRFQSFFASLDAELPAPTRALLSISAFIQQWWWVFAVAGLIAVAGYFVAMRFPAGRLLRDRLLLATPVLGETIRASAIERFTRLLASMVGAGIALPDAMAVATGSLNNLAFELPLQRARQQMLDGAGLAAPIAGTKLFPGMAVQMIRVGEETGTLDSQLEGAAAFYARELDYKVKKLATLVEPAVIIVMGGVVGFVAIALVSAMYGIFRATSLT